MRQLFLAAIVGIASPAVAQVATIDPGMTRAQVIERLGAPASERTSNGFTYLFYQNGCERLCGMTDLVTLRGDSVSDAIFRSATRQFSGRSSSPVQGATARPTGPLAVPGTDVPPAVVGVAPERSPSLTPGRPVPTGDSVITRITASPPPPVADTSTDAATGTGQKVRAVGKRPVPVSPVTPPPTGGSAPPPPASFPPPPDSPSEGAGTSTDT